MTYVVACGHFRNLYIYCDTLRCALPWPSFPLLFPAFTTFLLLIHILHTHLSSSPALPDPDPPLTMLVVGGGGSGSGRAGLPSVSRGCEYKAYCTVVALWFVSRFVVMAGGRFH